MERKGSCSRCKYKWYVCDNCRAAGCGNKNCSQYQWLNLSTPFGIPKCRTCRRK